METIKVNMTPCEDVQTIHASQNDNEARQWGFELHNNGEKIDSSSISDQMVFKVYKGGTEQILPENGAVPVTAPFVGDIKYPDATRTDQEFLYRQSPTEDDGLAWIKSIKGKTVKFNQLCDYDFRKSLVDFTLSNHELTFNFTSTTNTNWWQYQIYSALEYTAIANHKYLVRLETKSNYPVGNIVFNGDRSVLPIKTLSDGYVKRGAVFTSLTSATTKFYFRPIGNTITANFHYENIFTRNIQLFDLTQMFGSGNEPTTVEDFETWLSNNIGLFPYYDYCQGAMLSFGGRNVKFNQLAQNGNFESITGWGGNNSSITVANNVLTGTVTTSHATAGLRKMDNISFVANHKYLISAVMSCSVASDYCVARFYATGYDFRTDALTITANTKKRQIWTLTPTSAFSGSLYIYPKYSYPAPLALGDTFTFENVMLIDLTEMFGAGNEPSAEGILELFVDDYYEYTTGQYMNLGQPVSLKTTGKNLVFKTIEICNIDSTGKLVADGQSYYDMAVAYVVQGQTYTFQPPHGNEIMGYFESEPSIGSQTYDRSRITNGTSTFTAQITGYVAIRLNRPETNAQLEIGTSATSYDDYIEPSTLSIPLDEFPNGMDGVGDVHDEKNETGYKKKIGFVVVDGSEDENWGFQSGTPNQCYHRMVVSTTLNNPPSISNYANRVTMYASLTGISYIIYSGELRISDMNGAITDVASLRAWLQAHPLVVAYALQEPLENYSVVDLGTLNWHTGGTNTSGIVRMESSDLRSVIKKPSAGNVPARILCNIYETKSADNTYTKNGAISLNTAGDIDVYDSNYNTSDKVSAFKQAMSGVYLLYEKQNPQGFTTATLVTENGEVALANENGVLVGKCNSDVSADAGFIEGKIKLSDSDGDVYSNKIQIHVERSPQ